MFRDNLLVALDVETSDRALALASELRGVAGGFKVGTRLFTQDGPALVRALVDSGSRVFLDLKFHDIPNTVAQTIESAVQTGVWMIDVHAAGGVPMMQAAARAAREAAERAGTAKPLLVAVTVLTSMDEPTLHATGVQRPLLDQVVMLAKMTREAGLDGVVASAQEAPAIRAACGPDFTIVTPGIRSAAAGANRNDQMRIVGPAAAIQAGANYIVVGRPIIAAADPRAAAEAIVREIEEGIGDRGPGIG